MAVSWNWQLFDEHLATEISLFTEANIPELVHPEAEFWPSNYFLNSAMRTAYTSPTKEYVFTFIRRTTAAFEEYDLGRDATLRFVERRSAGEQPVKTYRSALHHWEQCVALAWQAIDVWRKLTGVDAFKVGDGSPEERLNLSYNRSKHTDKAIAAAQMPPVGPLAMWLANNGLRTTESLVEWVELHDVLGDLGKSADLLQDPEKMRSPSE
ncbi:MAG: hypothetical protein Q7V57_01715 [Actinomycetota bacterium]|nr:hypothetical protein [Actinomycetota bacterium]